MSHGMITRRTSVNECSTKTVQSYHGNWYLDLLINSKNWYVHVEKKANVEIIFHGTVIPDTLFLKNWHVSVSVLVLYLYSSHISIRSYLIFYAIYCHLFISHLSCTLYFHKFPKISMFFCSQIYWFINFFLYNYWKP